MATVKHVVLILHGIRTHAEWLDEFEKAANSALSQRGDDGATKVIRFRYGYFPLIQFLLPWLFRKAIVLTFLSVYEKAQSDYPNADISVVAHSFGVYVFCQALSEYTALKFRYAILLGSVAPEHFDWAAYMPDRVQKVVNECALKDVWPVFARLFVYGMGSSGVFGFVGFGADSFENRKFANYGHSHFFYPAHFRQFWLPFLLDGEVRASSQQHHRPPVWLRMASGCRWATKVVLPLLLVAWLGFAAAGAMREGPASYLSQGREALRRDEYDVAKHQFVLARGQSSPRSSSAELADALLGLGQVEFFLGSRGTAERHWNDSLALLNHSRLSTSEKKTKAEVLRRLGRMPEEGGAWDSAMGLYRQASALFLEAKDLDGHLRALGDQARAHRLSGDLARGNELLAEAINAAKGGGSTFEVADLMRLQAVSWLRDPKWIESRGSQAQAMRDIRAQIGEAHARFKLVGSQRGEAAASRDLGDAYRGEKDYRKALEKYNDALKITEAIRYRAQEGAVILSIGYVKLDLGEIEPAERDFDKALTIFRELKLPREMAYALDGLARANLHMEAFETASVYFRQAASLFRSQNHPHGEAQARATLARTYHRMGQTQHRVDYQASAKREAALARELFTKLRRPDLIDQLEDALRR